MQIDVVVDVKTTLGEGPLWDVEQQRLYWIDSFDGRVFRATHDGREIRAWDVPMKIGSMALRKDGEGAIVSLARGFHTLDFATGEVELIHDPESGEKLPAVLVSARQNEARLTTDVERLQQQLEPMTVGSVANRLLMAEQELANERNATKADSLAGKLAQATRELDPSINNSAGCKAAWYDQNTDPDYTGGWAYRLRETEAQLVKVQDPTEVGSLAHQLTDITQRLTDVTNELNDDLNVPRALAVAWETLRGNSPPQARRATLLNFDRIFGLRLAEWAPKREVAPDAVTALAEARLPRLLFDYIDGGACEEVTLAANCADFRRVSLRQRVLREQERLVAPVGGGRGRRIATHERRDRVEAGLGQRRQQRVVRVGVVGEAVQAEDERPPSGLEVVERQPVRPDAASRHRHGATPGARRGAPRAPSAGAGSRGPSPRRRSRW